MAPEPAPTPSYTFSPSLLPFTIPVTDYLVLHPEFEAIAAGALVFDNQDRLLILQRAADDSMPNLWEVPGGACDAENESILNGIAREVWEESGLKVSALKHLVGDGQVFFTRRRLLQVCKYTFAVEVHSTEGVKLDPDEHQNYLWVTEEECSNHRVERERAIVEFKFTTPAQEATILEGFRLRKAARSQGFDLP
jgi:8-oxo-dGTP pyrophosphatase MutT (NUDIX family)